MAQQPSALELTISVSRQDVLTLIVVPAINLIDDDYGPANGFWHTVEDCPDKLSEYSFGMVAHVLGFLAVVCAMVNVIGGFMVTDRMLAMFKSKTKKKD